MEETEIYLGASLQKVLMSGDTACWAMSLDKYVQADVTNIDERLSKTDHKIPSRYDTPMGTEYHPSEDVSSRLNGDGVKIYQELIRILCWAVEVSRVDILLEVSLLLYHLALMKSVHLQAVYRVFGYLKQVRKRQLYFDPEYSEISEDQFHKFDWKGFYRDAAEAIPLDMSRPRGKTMTIHCFFDTNYAGDKEDSISMTGILIICNRAPIIWHAKSKNRVETSTFGA